MLSIMANACIIIFRNLNIRFMGRYQDDICPEMLKNDIVSDISCAEIGHNCKKNEKKFEK